jgi:anthranilate phosphoribosyltransferase
VATGKPPGIAADVVLHRVGGGSVSNLRLSPLDLQQTPPGLSVLLNGTPQEAATQMRRAFPGSRKWRQTAGTVASATAAAVRQAGFDVVADPTTRFPNHALLIHPTGAAGFTDANLATLARTFTETTGC